MKTGNVILVSNPFWWKHPFSSLLYMIVRLFIGKWHHCAMVWNTEAGIVICEAIGKGVMTSSFEVWLTNWPNRITEIIPVECNPEEIRKHMGKKYDKASFLFYCIVKIFSKKWFGRTGEGASDQLYCFEYAALAHQLPKPFGILPSEFIDQIKA